MVQAVVEPSMLGCRAPSPWRRDPDDRTHRPAEPARRYVLRFARRTMAVAAGGRLGARGSRAPRFARDTMRGDTMRA
jgi:hypothetical protein